jgi:hypothetical protein
MNHENSGKLGIGSLSPLISVLTLFCLIQYRGEISILDIIVNYIGLPTYSASGIYYTMFYALIPMVIAYHIAIKYPWSFEALFGKKVSQWFIIVSGVYGINVII